MKLPHKIVILALAWLSAFLISTLLMINVANNNYLKNKSGNTVMTKADIEKEYDRQVRVVTNFLADVIYFKDPRTDHCYIYSRGGALAMVSCSDVPDNILAKPSLKDIENYVKNHLS